MADLIQKTDSLNDGRVKLNEAIKDADKALTDAGTAKTTANQALAKSTDTQTQLDTIVIEGDSSVEAAQARVDSKGNPHTTLKARLDAEQNSVMSQLVDMAERTIGYGTMSQRPHTPQTADLYFLTDKKKRIEFNGSIWQYLDGSPVDEMKIVDGNLYPISIFTPQSVSSGGQVQGGGNNGIDMKKDFITYTKIKLSNNNTDFFHLSFQINSVHQFQLTFGYDWTTGIKDGSTISIYDYINTAKVKLGKLDLYSASHEVVVWYDHKWGYLNVYVDKVLIGSWKPSAGGANISNVNGALFEIGNGTALVTFDYIYMATPLVTAIGDSITGGATTHAPNPDHYSGVDNYASNYPKIISDYLQTKGIRNYFVVNKGVNSDTTAGMKSRFNTDVVSKGCKYVLVHGGINDYPTNNVNATITNKKSMADTAISNNITPMILGVTPTKADSVSNSHQYSINLHDAEAKSYQGYYYVDLWSSIEGETNIADGAKLSDSVHPNLTGYTAIANEIKKYMNV